MATWPRHPIIYEINTWVWLGELEVRAKSPVTLASVPKREWDGIAALGVDAVWFMGVWERSPAGIRVSMGNPGLLADFHRALPDFTESDNAGSPYCVRGCSVDPHLGGPQGLAIARRELASRGIRLILDFVPNHVAPDHAWAKDHPNYFIQGDLDDLAREPSAYLAVEGRVFACGRDPYFPAWSDVLQLNAFDAGLREAAIRTLADIAAQSDGVRCDMAMLMMNDVFERTWGARAGSKPKADYWPQVIPRVKAEYPDFRFIAEAYWDLEWALQQQGFDYCYDKRLYDRLEHGSAESVRLHLSGDAAYQEKLVHFVENHDEPRSASAFPPAKHRAAAVTALTLPGASLVHEGQLEGRRVRLPVFLARRPPEPSDAGLREFYTRLLEVRRREVFALGTWRMCSVEGWPDNQSHRNMVGWCWEWRDSIGLIVVNLSETPAQGLLRVPLDRLQGRSWKMQDAFSAAVYERSGDEMCGPGVYVELGPWGFHVLTSSSA